MVAWFKWADGDIPVASDAAVDVNVGSVDVSGKVEAEVSGDVDAKVSGQLVHQFE